MGPIRYIFPAFVLAFWVICGFGIASGQWTGIHWVMLGLAHLGCAIIFANFVYVFTYGYGDQHGAREPGRRWPGGPCRRCC